MAAKFTTNLEAVSELIGSLAGMAEGLDQPEYMNEVLAEAHGKATDAFDMAAAATAQTGHLAHMYEFGTSGITRGPVAHPNPLAQDARLWRHEKITGTGTIEAGFVFRPALTRNPAHTVKSTGVASKYLRKLSKRKYVFWNRALVMETGQQVEIRAKNSDVVFIPFNGDPAQNGNDPAGRGFIFYDTEKGGPVKTRPGGRHTGTFTTFWTTWWEGTGQNTVNNNITKRVFGDVKKAQVQAERKARRAAMKSAFAADPSLIYKKAKKTGEEGIT